MIIRRLSSDTRAATAIEYGLIVALIALAIIGALRGLGGGTGGMWTIIADKFTAAVNGTGGDGSSNGDEGDAGGETD